MLLKLIHFFIYACIYIKKVFLIKLSNIQQRCKKIFYMIALNEIEHLQNSLDRTKFTKLPKHVSIVVNGLIKGDGNLLVSHDGKVDGQYRVFDIEALASLIAWLTITKTQRVTIFDQKGLLAKNQDQIRG